MGKQGGGTKGAARKAKYLAHKAGSSRKGNKKQRGGYITVKNKAARVAKHANLLEKHAERKALRLDLLDQVKKAQRSTVGALSKKYGTLNICRLTDILNNTAEDMLWYKARVAKKEAVEQARMVRENARIPRKKSKDREMSPEVSSVHK